MDEPPSEGRPDPTDVLAVRTIEGFRALQGDFFADCERASLAGLISLDRRAHITGVHAVSITEFSDSKSLQRPLTRAFGRKAAPLGQAKRAGYVTMLAVDVEREDARTYLAEGAQVPNFPREIDHLWLIVRAEGGGLAEALHARRDERRLAQISVSGL